jgi:hypothetical protein
VTNPVLEWAYDPHKPLWHPATLVVLVNAIRWEWETFWRQTRNHWEEKEDAP